MATDTQEILCGSCRVPLQGVADPEPQDIYACPKCGAGDTVENVIASAKAFAVEAAKHFLQESLRQAVRGSKIMKLDSQPIKKGSHRFITNHQF